MVTAWMKIAVLVLKAPPASTYPPATQPKAFSEPQNAATADVLIGTGEFCKRLKGEPFKPVSSSFGKVPSPRLIG
jgi:hypothetical protein